GCELLPWSARVPGLPACLPRRPADVGAAAVGFVAFALARDGAESRRLAGGIGLAALTPLVLGSAMLSRFDLWPAALTAAWPSRADRKSTRLNSSHGSIS